MISASKLNEVLQFLESSTETIHPCKVTTSASRVGGEMSLHWDVKLSVLFPGDQEIPLSVTGIDDGLEWAFNGTSGYDIPSLSSALGRAWEQCEAELFVDA